MPSNSTAAPPISQDRMPAGPAMAETWLAENSQPEPKIAPRPMKVRSVRLRWRWNFPVDGMRCDPAAWEGGRGLSSGRLAVAVLLVGVGRLAAAGDELVDAFVQYRQRHRAGGQHRVMEGADVELRAQRLLGACAVIADGHLAQVIGQRLCRPRD